MPRENQLETFPPAPKRSGSRLFLSGFFGFSNSGDEALLQAVLRGFRHYDANTHFAILCGNPEALCGESNVRAVDWRDPAAIMDALYASDAVVFAGGLLHDVGGVAADRLFLPSTGGLALHSAIGIFAGLIGRKSIHLCVGVGPLHSEIGKELTRRVCELAASISVRDEGSRTILTEAGLAPGKVKAAADLVFAYPPEPMACESIRRKVQGAPTIGLALRSWDRGVDADFWERQVAQSLDRWLRGSGGYAVFLPMQTGEGAEDDRLIAERVIARLSLPERASSVTRALSTGEMRWALGECDLVIGMRYHAVAFAAVNGTPFLALSYDPKVSSLAKQLGLEQFDHPVDSVRAPDFANAIEGAFAQEKVTRARLAEAVPELRRLALAAFESASIAVRWSAPEGTPDHVIAQSLRTQAERIRELQPLEAALARSEAERERAFAETARALGTNAELVHTNAGLVQTNAGLLQTISKLEAQAVADGAARDQIEKDFRTIHAWSEAQGEHIKALIADVEEAQRAAGARRFRLPSLGGIRKAVHLALDVVQKLTPETIRRAIRPAYLVVYRSVFPAGVREFQQIASSKPSALRPANPKALPGARTAAAMPLRSAWPIGTFPLVSVVLPVWNQPELLGAGIRSILDQTYRNLELIVVDDGSTADLLPVVSAFQSDPRFRCIRRPHEGLPRTLSAGFRMARGDFWTWTSADNLAHPEMVETLLRFLLRRPDVDMTFGNMDLIDDRGAPLLHSNYRVHAQRPQATNQLDLPHTVETLGLINDNFIGACFLYRAEMGRALGRYDDSLLGTEDYDYWLRMQSAGAIAHVDTDECLYSYRVHDDSLSGRHAVRIAQNAEALIDRNRERRQRWVAPGAQISSELRIEPSVSVDPSLLLVRKARDNRYPLWDVPSFRRPLLVYAGPIHQSIDWPFLLRLAAGTPDASLLMFSTDENHVQDPPGEITRCSNVIYLGYKRPAEWVSYLSQASVLLAPVCGGASATEVDGMMQLYLQAGKPVLATEAAAKFGFHLAPNITWGDDLETALRTEVDFALTDLYLQTISPAGRAAQKLKLARARSEAPPPVIPERNGPSILLETQSFHRGGLERVVLEMAQSLHDGSYPVAVAVVAEAGDMSRECLARGIPVAEVHGNPNQFAALLDRVQPDLLIPHYSTFGSEPAWRRGIPALGVIHNSYIWAGADLEREIGRADLFVSRYVAVSRTAKNFFSLRFGVDAEKIAVIPNGIDVDRCEQALLRPPTVTRAQLGIDPDDIVLLMVGSLIGTKAQLHAIAALALTVPHRRNIRLIIIGPPYDAAYAALLHQTVARLQLEKHVRILPESDSIFDFYRLADALLCTSLTEGWSLAMTEAMFCGLPVVSTDVGGAFEAIHVNRLGIVFRPPYDNILDLNASNLWAYATDTAPRNLDAIVRSIDTFCRDRNAFTEQGAAGPEIVRSLYSKPVIARRYEQEIDALLAAHYGEIRWQRL